MPLSSQNKKLSKKNIKKYSEFINFPIYLKTNKTFTREEEIPEPEKPETEAKDETKPEEKKRRNKKRRP